MRIIKLNLCFLNRILLLYDCDMSLFFLHLTTKIQNSVCFTPFSNSSMSTMLILAASRTSVKYQLLYAEFVKAFFVVQLAEHPNAKSKLI